MLKTQPLSLSVKAQADDTSPTSSSSWMKDMDPHEEEATDKILEHLIQSGARPYINAKGDIIEIVISITNGLNRSVPSHLSQPLKIMTDYIARWLCDYVEETNISSLSVAFGFDAQLEKKEPV